MDEVAQFSVNIYIETSLKGPAVREGAGEWLVEFLLRDGSPVTRSGIVRKEKTTENELTLELLYEAFFILNKTCSVRVNTPCGHVLNAVRNQWFLVWKRNGWMNAKGKPVKNAELWQQCSELFERHCTEFYSGPHSYEKVMREDIRKELEDGIYRFSEKKD